MEKVLENSTRTKKIHQFSIEALIGKGDNKTEDKSCPPASSGDVHRPSPKESQLQLLSQMKSANFRHLFNVSKCNPGNRTATSLTESDYHSILRSWIGHSESSVFQPFKIAATVSSDLTVNNPMFFSPLTLNSFVNRDVLQQSDAWLQARYSHLLNQRYPMGPHPSLYFHPYRKPKRNRTAFSPSQLMDLEESFERNHYVVGQERKQLAFKLQLSETQVKVWFQNRRTKDKRMRGEVDVSVTSQHSDDVADNDTDSETANDQNSEFFPEEDEVATSKFPEAELKQ